MSLTTRFSRTLATGAALLFLAGCGPTEYEPARGVFDDTGYTSRKFSEDRYLVTFEGNTVTSRQRVESLMLLRAGELADETGHPYFAIVEDETEREVTYNTYFSPPGFYGYGYRTFPYYSTYMYGARPRASVTDSYEAYAMVEMLDEKPADRDEVYETGSIIEKLRPLVEGET